MKLLLTIVRAYANIFAMSNVFGGEEFPAGQPDMFVRVDHDTIDWYNGDGVQRVDVEGINPAPGTEPEGGQALIDYWDTIGLDKDDDGFYNLIRKNGCSSCGSHTPGCCDGCA